jgi:hypothetical protein
MRRTIPALLAACYLLVRQTLFLFGAVDVPKLRPLSVVLYLILAGGFLIVWAGGRAKYADLVILASIFVFEAVARLTDIRMLFAASLASSCLLLARLVLSRKAGPNT